MSEVNYDDGKIHGWNGGDCPVHPKTQVKFWGRIGKVSIGVAGFLRWSHTNASDDIIAFYVLKEYREPREFWINIYPDTGPATHVSRDAADISAAPSRTDCIRVREVLE